MFIIFFDNNSMLVDEKDEAILIANSLLANGYSYVTIANNEMIDVESDIDIIFDEDVDY